MLTCEGFKMFDGSALVSPKNGLKPFRITGTWLFNPETNCWYVDGRSFSNSIISDIQEDKK